MTAENHSGDFEAWHIKEYGYPCERRDSSGGEMKEDIIEDEIDETIRKAVERGLMEIVGYTKSGEAMYNLTQKGKEHAETVIERIDNGLA